MEEKEKGRENNVGRERLSRMEEREAHGKGRKGRRRMVKRDEGSGRGRKGRRWSEGSGNRK